MLTVAGYQVHMTRESDVSVELGDRTAYVARHPEAVAFISIHANAASNGTASGIETYYLDDACLKEHESHITQEERSLLKHHRKRLVCGSKKLAHVVHDELIAYAGVHHGVNDRKVRHRPGQVLFAMTPSILIECGFLSNSKERALLNDDKYQDGFVQALASGIKKFVETTFAGEI